MCLGYLLAGGEMVSPYLLSNHYEYVILLTGGEIVSPPPHAQHISSELKPGTSKVPQV